MSEIAQFSLTPLFTLVLLVFRVIRVTIHVAHVTTIQSSITVLQAASLWCFLEVFSTRCLDHIFGVVLACELQLCSHLASFAHIINDSFPEIIL